MSFLNTFSFWQIVAAWIVLGTCALVIGFVFAAPLLARPDKAHYPLVFLLLFYLVCFGASLDYALPAAFGGVRFMPEDERGVLLTFLAPLLVVAPLSLLPGYIRDVVTRLPLAWLTWPQTFRSIGGLFLVYYAYHQLPAGFALPAGIGDLLVGCTAPFMTRYVLRYPHSTRWPLLWNGIGVLDFIIAVSSGLALGAPSQYPLVMIPGFLVPVALLMHLFSFYNLTRRPSLSPAVASASQGATQREVRL